MNQETQVHRYIDQVTACIISFQFVEEALRMFLAKAEVLIARQLRDFTFYNSNRKIKLNKKAALGSLIEQFTAYCEDQELIRELKEIIEKRNHYAHSALLMSIDEIHDLQGIEQKIREASKINDNARVLLFKVTERVKQIDASDCTFGRIY